jgi:hypothetical protein
MLFSFNVYLRNNNSRQISAFEITKFSYKIIINSSYKEKMQHDIVYKNSLELCNKNTSLSFFAQFF